MDPDWDFMQWPIDSDERYWDKLAELCPYDTIYAEDGGPQPLIDMISRNLSQTPREQCEIMGFVQDQEDLSRNGPGQRVIIHGLVNQQQLNGCTGRVLPLTGQGAPRHSPAPTRAAVRLTDLTIISVRQENMMYYADPANPYTATHANKNFRHAPSAATSTTAGQPRAQFTAFLPVPNGSLAELVRVDVRRGSVPMLLRISDLLRATMLEPAVRCIACGDSSQQGYVALHRNVGYSSTPVPSAVQLSCVDCVIRAAEAAHVPINAESVEKFVDDYCMEGGDACRILMKMPMCVSGGLIGASTLY